MIRLVRFSGCPWEPMPDTVSTVRPAEQASCAFDTEEQAKRWAKVLNTKHGNWKGKKNAH